MPKKVKLTDKVFSKRDITFFEVLNKLHNKFPEGFTSNAATAFLKREFNPLILCFSLSFSEDLRYSGYVSRERNPNPGAKYIYDINSDRLSLVQPEENKINLDNIIDSYNTLITPRLGDGSLRQEMLDNLRLVLVNYLNPEQEK